MTSTLDSSLKAYRGERVVVLGATGFIGSWVTRALHALGAELFLLVRDRARGDALATQLGTGVHVITRDFADVAALAHDITVLAPAVAFNLAGYGVDPSERDERVGYQINSQLVETICRTLHHSRDQNWRGQALVHAGSALEYGAAGGNLSEDSVPRPTTWYGKSKVAGTEAVQSWGGEYGMPCVTTRLFTVYGAGEHAGRLLPSLLRSAETHTTLQLTAGTQRRDFTYVEDVAIGLLHLGVAAARPGEIVNLATGSLVSVRHFAETAAEILEIPPSRLQFGALPTRVEEMQHERVSVARLNSLTGWLPPTSIAEGIRKTVALARS